MRFFAANPYLLALVVLSAGVAVAEAIQPRRLRQPQWRAGLWSDCVHLVFNGHLLGVIVYAIATSHVIPLADRGLDRLGCKAGLYANAAAHWPLWLQIPMVLVLIDFLEWCVHRLLHRVPFLWELHKIHHSVGDGEMDWIVSFRFHWAEVIVYKSLLYLPLAFFGFAPAAVLVHAIVGTLVGHLNHANLDLGHGPWRYIVNSPRMHLWHHDRAADGAGTVNFAIIFSAWDWMFGTARLPDAAPTRLGFKGDEQLPRNFLAHALWPLLKTFVRRSRRPTLPSAERG